MERSCYYYLKFFVLNASLSKSEAENLLKFRVKDRINIEVSKFVFREKKLVWYVCFSCSKEINVVDNEYASPENHISFTFFYRPAEFSQRDESLVSLELDKAHRDRKVSNVEKTLKYIEDLKEAEMVKSVEGKMSSSNFVASSSPRFLGEVVEKKVSEVRGDVVSKEVVRKGEELENVILSELTQMALKKGVDSALLHYERLVDLVTFSREFKNLERFLLDYVEFKEKTKGLRKIRKKKNAVVEIKSDEESIEGKSEVDE